MIIVYVLFVLCLILGLIPVENGGDSWYLCLAGFFGFVSLVNVPVTMSRDRAENERVEALNELISCENRATDLGVRYGFDSDEYRQALQEESHAAQNLKAKGGNVSI